LEATKAAEPVRLLSPEQVAGLLQVPVGTLYQWRHRGEGPRSMRVGRHIRFDPGDVASWVEAKRVEG
jgi:excisionase family DNA binding protein